MAPSRSFLFAAASVVLFESRVGAEDIRRTVKVDEENNCLVALNAARQEAGLAPLEKDTRLIPSHDEEGPAGILVDVCKSLLDGNDFKPLEEYSVLSTYALYNLGEVKDEDLTKVDPQCGAAVKKWQEGFSAFEANSPVNRQPTYPETSSQEIAFVTLYNPVSPAQGQCALTTCKGTPEVSPAAQKAQTTVAGLVCVTEPNAFGESSLFTQQQWDNIKKVLSNSAVAAMPSLAAFAAVLAALVLS
nr:suface antigen 2 [Eimeria intestinalis]